MRVVKNNFHSLAEYAWHFHYDSESLLVKSDLN